MICLQLRFKVLEPEQKIIDKQEVENYIQLIGFV